MTTPPATPRRVHQLVMKKFIDHDLIWPITACKKPMTSFHVQDVTWHGKVTCLRCLARKKHFRAKARAYICPDDLINRLLVSFRFPGG